MKQLKEKEYEAYQQYLYNKSHGYIWTADTLEFICNANNNDPEQIGKQILDMKVRLQNECVSRRTTDKHNEYIIRRLRKDEVELLDDFLYEAIFVPKGTAPPERSIIDKPELRVYIDDFGSRDGDHCLVADFGGKVVGVVWVRIMDDYGHIDDNTPSFAVSVLDNYRRQGIGSQLMVRMLELLKWQGYEQASLAVQKANYAVKMYKDIGFKTVKESDEEYIMVCVL